MNDVARLWSAGFALGASFDNSVVYDQTRVLNAEGLRYSDECARHKVLDVTGDLALAGLPLLGAYRSVRGGRAVTPKPAAAWSAAWSPRPTVPTCPDFRLRNVLTIIFDVS
jgi:UDP-3-O-acyl-N-acetylglucosamine deacetylase